MIAIIDSGGANIASVKFALERLGATSVLTDDPAVICDAEKVLLPGVGAAPVAMQRLIDSGLVDCIRGLTQPVMGICLGMQLLTEMLSPLLTAIRTLPSPTGWSCCHCCSWYWCCSAARLYYWHWHCYNSQLPSLPRGQQSSCFDSCRPPRCCSLHPRP